MLLGALMAEVSKDLLLVDFNELHRFTPSDFVDMDHFSERGAEKFSRLLVEIFGK